LESEDEGFGHLIDLSDDGSTLVTTSSNVYTIYIYELASSSSLYELLDTKDYRARQVAVSGDGSIIGFTAENEGCRVYERLEQKGIPIDGAWTSVALNNDGSIIILGSISDASDSAGSAFVLQWKEANGSMDWVQMGGEITGDDIEEDSFGDRETVSITSDGLIVSIGSGRSADEKGIVRVYYYDESAETWNQRGNDLIGDNTEDSLARNKISSDGTYLVAGSPDGGYYKIFQWNAVDYEVRSTVSIGVTYNHGKWVDISANGASVANGNPSIDNGKGTIYLYETGVPVDYSGDEGSDSLDDSPAFDSLDYGMTSFVMLAMIPTVLF